MDDMVEVVAEVVSRRSDNGRSFCSTVREVGPKAQSDYLRDMARRRMVDELVEQNLIFGCLVGRISIRTEPWTGYINSDPVQTHEIPVMYG